MQRRLMQYDLQPHATIRLVIKLVLFAERSKATEQTAIVEKLDITTRSQLKDALEAG